MHSTACAAEPTAAWARINCQLPVLSRASSLPSPLVHLAFTFCPLTLSLSPARLLQGYFNTGDAAVRDEDGYIHVMARADDVINVAAHRLSTGAMEGAVSAHPLVAECAVFGAADALKGQVPWGVVVLKETAAGQAAVDRAKVAKEVVDLVRREVGPVAAFKTVVFVARLPKTRSGKVLRATMKAIADNVPYRAPPTLDDPAVLEEITSAFKTAQH